MYFIIKGHFWSICFWSPFFHMHVFAMKSALPKMYTAIFQQMFISNTEGF